MAVFIALLLPSLVQDGMFMDGILYAVAAKNLAHGNGTRWNMHINSFTHTSFHEQPPLMFWMESFFFRIFGDSIYTERIYSFAGACISGWLIIMTWNLLFEHEPGIKKVSWIPFLLWIICPVCFWTYSNNLEEISMGIFILLSVWFILKALSSPSPWGRVGVGLAAVCIFLASFCKGIQATFTIVLPGIYWLVYRNFSFMKMIFYSLLLIAIPAGIYLLLFTDPQIFQFYKDYYYGRIDTAFHASSLYTTDSHFYLLGRLFNELLGPVIICTVMFFIIRKIFADKNDTAKPRWKIFSLMFLTGLAGTLPLMVTLEQRRFYLVPSLPFYAIALSSIIAPGAAMLIQRIDMKKKFYRVFKIVSVGLLAGAFIFTFFQKRKKDQG